MQGATWEDGRKDSESHEVGGHCQRWQSFFFPWQQKDFLGGLVTIVSHLIKEIEPLHRSSQSRIFKTLKKYSKECKVRMKILQSKNVEIGKRWDRN